MNYDADDAFHDAHEVFLAACRVADLLGEPGLTAERRAELLAEHDRLVERHTALGELCFRLLQPNAAVH